MKKYSARELTVGEIREIMKAADAGNLEFGVIDMLFPEGVPGAAVKTSTGFTDEDLGKMKPSEIEQLMEDVKKANPLYVSMLERMRNFLEGAAKHWSGTSAGPLSRSEMPA